MTAPDGQRRRIAPGLIALAVTISVASLVVENWRREALMAAIEEGAATISIVAGVLALLAAIELLLRGSARLWGRIFGLGVVSAIVLWRLFHSSGIVLGWIAGLAWAAALVGMIVVMLRNPRHGR